MHSFYYIFSILSICFFKIVTTEEYVYVNTSRGPLFGYHVDYGKRNISDKHQLWFGEGDVFLGIPYVKPPVGELRFKRPQRLEKFSEEPYNATFMRSMCPQPFKTGTSEDCLMMNIFTPKASPSSKYPVLVWIHGGAGSIGSAQEFTPKGVIRNLVSCGVVVVTIQYRLSLLGFFTTMTEDFAPNLALYDIIEALKFVQEEISNFGGDPNKITIGGSSAGACYSDVLSYSPLARGLFHQVFIESGTAWLDINGTYFQPLSKIRAKELCGITDDDWENKNFVSIKECLADVDIERSTSLDGELFSNNINLGWPVIPGSELLPDWPENLYKTRENLPVLIGSMEEEDASFVMGQILFNNTQLSTYTEDFFDAYFKKWFPRFYDYTDEILALAKRTYMPAGTESHAHHLSWAKGVAQTSTAAFWTAYQRRNVEQHLLNGNKEVYMFEHVYKSKLGQVDPEIPGWERPAHHVIADNFIWMYEETWEKAAKDRILTEDDFKMADYYGEMFTNFIKTGKPSQDWTPSNLETMNYMEISESPQIKHDYRSVDHVVFNHAIPIIMNSSKLVEFQSLEAIEISGKESQESNTNSTIFVWTMLGIVVYFCLLACIYYLVSNLCFKSRRKSDGYYFV